MERKDKIYNQELLSDPEILNSKIGVQLIDNYSLTNPDDACICMVNAFSELSQERIEKISEYRSGLVFTLSRLCFNKSTFESAVQLMLKFAATEKEEAYSYGRIGLQKLFFPKLGATEVDLKTRMRFVSLCAGKQENIRETMDMLNCCISFQTAFFHDGTERLADRQMMPYNPQIEEVREYVRESVGLLMGYVSTEHQDGAIGILEDHVIELCRERFADVIIPKIEEICAIKQNHWDTMLDKLLLFQEDMKGRLEASMFKRYIGLIEVLSSDDFVFRFKRVEKELYNSPSRFSTEKIIEDQRSAYKSLGEEFCQNNLLTPELLNNLYGAEVISTSPFGEMVARMLPEEMKKQFVEYSVAILNDMDKAQSDILIDFAYGLTDEEFDGVLGMLLSLKNKKVVFAALARRSTSFDNEYMGVLMDLVSQGKASTDCFVTYWSNFRFMYMKDEEIAIWLRKVMELPNGPQTVLHILQSAITGDAYNKMPKTVEVATATVMQMPVNFGTIMQNYQYWNVMRLLLEKGNNSELAKQANEVILGFIKNHDDFLINNYEIIQTYRLLLNKYFDDVWERLSVELLSNADNGWLFYKLKNVFGSMIGGPYNEVGLLFENDHNEALMEWCRKNPTVAPARLMDMVPVFEGKGFSKIIYMLLDEFGEQMPVLDALSHNMGCFGWTGSVNVLYEKEIIALETLENHHYKAVSDWSKKMILILKNDMEREVI